MDYLQTFVEEVGQKMVPKRKLFIKYSKIESQDRTERIVNMNRHRPLTQYSAANQSGADIKTLALLNKSLLQNFDRRKKKNGKTY